jgi:hypothetical protein
MKILGCKQRLLRINNNIEEKTNSANIFFIPSDSFEMNELEEIDREK